ncbi:cytochrome c-type biogenesis protein [Phenylobacterium kunshanense]|uniref:Cytochrome c-type biogenesis protein n=1 Tax=Phenylobacterium kunshanense TaxID=1445034 RepID=A0A328BU47_9CAUL|nr:cytochrome c-type biogenesis protein [Phenylobacterium kunshanense]RAK68568.1 cytochrome c-type biogenesis protein CcmH [Phenylobacterium kunshanense]
MRRVLPLAPAFALLALLLLASPAAAVNPDEQLPDPAQEARAVELSRELRCVVCQNQSIDDSDAALARDLRIILRERIAAGDTDKQAIDHIVARYGSFVQLRPPVRGDTLALWFGPLGVLVLGGVGAYLYIRSRTPAAAAALTAAEEAEAAELLKTDKAD